MTPPSDNKVSDTPPRYSPDDVIPRDVIPRDVTPRDVTASRSSSRVTTPDSAESASLWHVMEYLAVQVRLKYS